jgi:hypothetical protein
VWAASREARRSETLDFDFDGAACRWTAHHCATLAWSLAVVMPSAPPQEALAPLLAHAAAACAASSPAEADVLLWALDRLGVRHSAAHDALRRRNKGLGIVSPEAGPEASPEQTVSAEGAGDRTRKGETPKWVQALQMRIMLRSIDKQEQKSNGDRHATDPWPYGA